VPLEKIGYPAVTEVAAKGDSSAHDYDDLSERPTLFSSLA